MGRADGHGEAPIGGEGPGQDGAARAADPESALPETVVLIAGPTASGKSALALALAQRLGAEVINADSMQIYRDLRVLTARPSPDDEAASPHRLYGVLDGAERCSAGRFADLAAAALKACARRARPALIVGGTGLYFRALTDGLSPMPDVPAAILVSVRGRLEREGAGALHDSLARRDPASAALVPASDPQRLTRALGLLEATGHGLAHWQGLPGRPIVARPSVSVVLDAPRPWLADRAARRFAMMLEGGAVEETQALLARRLDAGLPIMKAVGVREIAGWLDGRWDRAAALEQGCTATRQYIKRQTTWFRHQMTRWCRLDATKLPQQNAVVVEKALQAVDRTRSGS